MDDVHTLDEFRSEIEASLGTDSIQVEIAEDGKSPAGIMISAWQRESGDEQYVYTAGPIDLDPEEAKGLARSIRAHFSTH